MPLQSPDIPVDALPTRMANPNSMRVTYRTNLLFPADGPLTSTRTLWFFQSLMDDLGLASATIDAVRTYGRGKPRGLRLDAEPLRSARWIDFLRSTNTVSDEMREQDPQRARILRGLRRGSVVLADLFDGEVLRTGRDLLSPALARVDSSSRELLRELARLISARQRRPLTELGQRLVDKALERGSQAGDLRRLCAADRQARADLNTYAAWVVWRNLEVFGMGANVLLQLPADEQVVRNDSSEWALQRIEELELRFDEAMFRGPVQALPVAPKSRRTVTESWTEIRDETQLQSEISLSREGSVASELSEWTLRTALDGLTEHGISAAGEFARDEVRRSSLSQERRLLTFQALREHSLQQTAASRSQRIRTDGYSVEYETEGKDPRRSTTELAFDVIAKTHATFRLLDVGLVWCPRIASPFLKMHAEVERYRRNQKLSYETQNYVPQPVRPFLKAPATRYERDVFIDLTGGSTVVDFEFEFSFQHEHWYIDVDFVRATLANFYLDAWLIPRIESSPSFDANSPYVGSVGGPHSASLSVSLSASVTGDGKALRGSLQVNVDPFLVSIIKWDFVRLSIPIRKYTDESAQELLNYEKELRDTAQRAQAVASKASQFALLQRDELIQRYESMLDLRREAFRVLVQQLFASLPPERRGYFEEVLTRTIDWREAKIVFESQPFDSLRYPQLRPDHFMNSPGVRLFLPIRIEGQALFFDTLRSGGSLDVDTGAQQVEAALAEFRAQIEEWRRTDDARLMLDEFDTEVMLGRHLEAVTSRFQFAE